METYDLEERLLAQMLFTGSCDQIDSVFDLYMKRKRTRESMVKAYFTQKCIQYFLEEKEIDSKVIGEIVMERLKNLDAVAYVRFLARKRSLRSICWLLPVTMQDRQRSRQMRRNSCRSW